MEDKVKNLIKDALENLQVGASDIVLEHPEDLDNGDYSTNIAFVVAKVTKSNPKELAGQIVKSIAGDPLIEKIEAKNGFINFYLARNFFSKSIEDILNQGENIGKNEIYSGKKIMVEYTDPNPFKPFHIGHLMTNAIGESIARILEHSGAEVSRANYQGDVGLHVAKAIYGILKDPDYSKHLSKDVEEKEPSSVSARYIGECYAKGSDAYEGDEVAKKEIDDLNMRIYDKADKKVNEIYQWGFEATMEAFEGIYKTLGTRFDYYFLESEMSDIGREIVEANIGEVFEKSDGAIVFRAEKYDPKLHTRVFITSADLPTYETKELGLAVEKFNTEPEMDLSITITANEQADYMRVVAKAISMLHPEFTEKMKHITHGMLRFASGKMSSRKGNIVTGESLLGDTKLSILEKMQEGDFSEREQEEISSEVSVSAVKYSILKQNIAGDIIYDFEKSISFEGDSGPYLQYSYTRANSVLEKAQKENILPDSSAAQAETFEVEKLLYKFPEIVLRSATEYEPHHITNYLIEIARAFNSFYGNTVIVDAKDKYSPYKVALTYAFTFVMKTGLDLLGIKAPKRM